MRRSCSARVGAHTYSALTAVLTRASPAAGAEQADELGRMTCELDKLILLNYEGFLKIAKKHDKWIGLSTRPWMLARLATATFFHERFDKARRHATPRCLPAALHAASGARLPQPGKRAGAR